MTLTRPISDPNDLGSGSTPPASPPVYRRAMSREENPNVFSRLTLGTNVGCEPQPDRGVVHPYQGKVNNDLKISACRLLFLTFACLLSLYFCLFCPALTAPGPCNVVCPYSLDQRKV